MVMRHTVPIECIEPKPRISYILSTCCRAREREVDSMSNKRTAITSRTKLPHWQIFAFEAHAVYNINKNNNNNNKTGKEKENHKTEYK